MQDRDVILVTGATGQIGTALVGRLAAADGQPLVRAATREVQAPAARLLQAMRPETVQPVAFDLHDRETLDAACAGVTKLCIIAPFVPDMAEWHRTVMDAVARAGTCRYVVKVSVTGARAPTSDPPPGRVPLAHWQGEEVVRESGISATMIRPNIFMQHFLTVPGLYARGDDRFYLPTGEGRIAFLDCRDIGALAARLVTLAAEERAPHEGQAYELTGPSAPTASEIASILGWATARTIAHVDGVEAFVAHCQQVDMPHAVKGVYAEAAEGWFGTVATDAFARVMGQLPTSFAQFAYDHAAYFQPA